MNLYGALYTLCPGNKRPKSFWNISYETRAMLMKFCTPFSE